MGKWTSEIIRAELIGEAVGREVAVAVVYGCYRGVSFDSLRLRVSMTWPIREEVLTLTTLSAFLTDSAFLCVGSLLVLREAVKGF